MHARRPGARGRGHHEREASSGGQRMGRRRSSGRSSVALIVASSERRGLAERAAQARRDAGAHAVGAMRAPLGGAEALLALRAR